MNKIVDIFWRRWPYLVTGLLCIISAFAIYKGSGEYIILALLGIPSLIFLMKNPAAVIITQIGYCAVIPFFAENLGFSTALYFTDILTFLLLIHIIINFPAMGYKLRVMTIPAVFLFLTLAVNIVSSVYNRIDLINFIWGLRINLRFPIFLIGCIMFMNNRVFDILWKLLLILMGLQVVFVSVQFFILGYAQDAVGGTFGIYSSGYIVQFFALVLLIAYLRYTEGKCSSLILGLVLITGLYVGILNEGKAIFIFDIVIFIVIFFQNGISVKKIFWLFLLIPVFMFASYILGLIYPNFADFLNWETISQYLTADSYGAMPINRLNGPEYFSAFFDPVQDLIGIGLGNAAASSYPVLQGDFYQAFYWTGFDWFHISYVYAESGYLGLYFNIGFFLSFLLVAYQLRNKISSNYTAFLIGMVLSCILTICYNKSLITEHVGFFYYILLGLPLAMAVNELHDYNYYPSRKADQSPLAKQ